MKPSPATLILLAIPTIASAQDWKLLGTVQSITNDFDSPTWEIYYDPSQSGPEVSLRFDFSKAPKCFPSVDKCDRKILVSEEKHVFNCDHTSRMTGGIVWWDNNEKQAWAPGKANIEHNSPLEPIQSVWCRSASLGYAPNVADMALTAAIITNGGVELNPISLPVKIAGEVYANNNHGTAKCKAVLQGTRTGGCAGFGAGIGGLVGGVIGFGVGAGIGALACWDVMGETAEATCYAPETYQQTIESISSSNGFNDRS